MREIGKKDELKKSEEANADDPTSWQAYEREPEQDAQAAEKKDKADEVVEQSPMMEAQKDKTLQ